MAKNEGSTDLCVNQLLDNTDIANHVLTKDDVIYKKG